MFGFFKPRQAEVDKAKSALAAAREGKADDGAITRMVSMLLNAGIDGVGPLKSARELAERSRAKSGSTEDAIKRIARAHLVRGGVGGFVTGLGGFVTLPIALPVNVAEFYVQATRMVGAIATLRGYDVRDQHVRTAILLTLTGSEADDVLKKAGMATGGGAVANFALKHVPPAGLLVINKAIGFRLMRGVGEKVFSRFGRGVPLLGGVIGGGLDGYMMKKIADHAMQEFPAVTER